MRLEQKQTGDWMRILTETSCQVKHAELWKHAESEDAEGDAKFAEPETVQYVIQPMEMKDDDSRSSNPPYPNPHPT